MLCDADKKRFLDIFDSLGDMYGKEVTIQTKRLYWAALCSMSMADIEAAISRHLLDEDRGRFMPKPADLIAALTGGQPSADEVVGLAMAANTPLGVIARIIIGSWDLANQDSYYLRQRGEEVLARLPDIRDRAARGEYTDHEIAIMAEKGVSPAAPLLYGAAPPPPEIAASLRQREAVAIEHIRAEASRTVPALPAPVAARNRAKILSLLEYAAKKKAM